MRSGREPKKLEGLIGPHADSCIPFWILPFSFKLNSML